MRHDMQRDFEWADGYGAQINQILKANIGAMVDVRTASPEQDMRRATDLVVTVPQGEVAVRIRRPTTSHRDLTLRYRRLCGGEWRSDFEVAKILAGFARWYFYGWTDGTGIAEWILADLDLVRESGALEDAVCDGREKFNKDRRTTFTWLTLDELFGIGALVASKLASAPGCCPACGGSERRLGTGGFWICAACSPQCKAA